VGSNPTRASNISNELASSGFSLKKNCALFCAHPAQISIPLRSSTALRFASMRMLLYLSIIARDTCPANAMTTGVSAKSNAAGVSRHAIT
jgi:hypothetical protein